ncbi:MAG: tyrosine-type recombinase/integrase [Bacteroidales bacterium]
MKGSIVERKTSKGKKKFYIVVDLPHLPGQKRKQKWFSSWDKKRDAENALPDIINQCRSTGYTNSQSYTMNKLVDDYLYKSQLTLSKSTLKRYKGCCNRITQEFNNVPISKIESCHISDYFRKLQDENFAVSTIQKHKSVLEQLFQHAQSLNLINISPVPRYKVSKKRKKDHNTWSVKEIFEFLESVKGQPIYMPVLLASLTGMRAGEVLALKWKDIDLEKKMLTINKAKDFDNTLKSPKNDSSRRTINLMGEIISELEAHKLLQKKAKLQQGAAYHKSDFVCTLANGKPMTPNYLTKTFPRKVKQYNFPQIRFHDLRHSFATISLSNGLHAKIVQEILGHSSIKVTLDTYSHVLPTVHQEAMNKIEKIFNAR